MERAEFLNVSQAAYVLGISEFTLQSLVHSGKIPHTYVQFNQEKILRFDPYTITEWMQSKPQLTNSTKVDFIEAFKAQINTRFPDTIETLQSFNKQFSPPHKGKGYSLAKIDNKKYGFLYYVRYIENGKLIMSRWNTHTNNEEAAILFAVDNRERILSEYHAKHDPKAELYHVLENYYSKDSPYLKIMEGRGRSINDQNRRQFNSFIVNVFIPFLKRSRVNSFNEITPPVIHKLQTELLVKDISGFRTGKSRCGKGLKPETINRYMSCVRTLLEHMVLDGIMADNTLNRVSSLRDRTNITNPRNIYELGKINGIFNKVWDNELLYLLCLLIYTTGLRNVEISNIFPGNIVEHYGYHFINVTKSKTSNGLRLVPLHPFVYEKLQSYIKRHGWTKSGRFINYNARRFVAANVALGKLAGLNKKELKEANITFYSGRHYWKTLMNANKLGDIEEIFMGHKVPKNVSDRYNHQDRQGQERITARVKEAFEILDNSLLSVK